MMSTQSEIELHGHRVCFRHAGEGPLIVLIHGITGRSDQWEPVIEHLAAEHTVLAPDLLGHGESAKPRGDYSLGAYASAVRDTMVALGLERATIVGHSLGDAEARSAFIESMRAVLDPGGQRVSALDRLYLAESLPTLIVWGEADPVIPVAHGRAAHLAMPGSRLELLDGVGHFPQLERPFEFARLLAEFVATTEAAELDTASLRDRLLGGDLA